MVSDLLEQLNADLAALVEQVRGSLVQVRNGDQGAGAGTIWHPDGLILTNAHVVRQRNPQVTLPDGRTLTARVVAHDERLDIAALKVDATGLPVIALGESSRLQPGEYVLAVGHPYGLLGAATSGIVIGVGSQWPEMPAARRDWVVVNLRLRPGNSGGPLVDKQGRLVGINTIMNGPDVGMAVPVHVVKAFLKRELGAAGIAEPEPTYV